MMNEKLNKTVGFKTSEKEYKNINNFCEYNHKTKKEIFQTGMIATDTYIEKLPYLRTQRTYHKNKAMYHLNKAIQEFKIMENYNQQINEKDKTHKIDQDIIILHDQNGDKIKFKPQYLTTFKF